MSNILNSVLEREKDGHQWAFQIIPELQKSLNIITKEGKKKDHIL